MSVVISLHGWDVLVSTANACCVQLLHDVSDGVYIAVGCTLHSFYQLEQLLLSLCDSILTAKHQSDAATVHLPGDNAVDSEATDVDSESQTSSSCLQHVCTNSITNKTETDCRHQQRFTRSGRPVKPSHPDDFTSSDPTIKDSFHGSLPTETEKTALKRRRGQGRPQGQGRSRGRGQGQGQGCGQDIGCGQDQGHDRGQGRGQGRGRGRVQGRPCQLTSSSMSYSDGKQSGAVEAASVGDVVETVCSSQPPPLVDEFSDQQNQKDQDLDNTMDQSADAGRAGSDVNAQQGSAVSFFNYHTTLRNV